ncbi:transposase, partial [Clostridium frigoris]|nr:transposase [Clostridium frigoris]
MNENAKYETIKKLVDSNGNKQRAAIELNCTVRHINRMIIGYKKKGKNFFIHGNRGLKPAHTLPDIIRQTIVSLYCTKYENTNLTQFSELLEEFEGITVSSNTVRSILLQEFILSPKAKRATKRALQAKLKDMGKSTKSKKEASIIQSSILAIEEAHPRRPRCAYFGEMLQMDASVHLWFGESKSQLHIAVDDSTGAIVGAYFDAQETLNGYYHV